MYDFCFTFPFAGLLALGGTIGFLTKGSVPSLLGMLGSAGILAVCAQLSLARYHQVSPCASLYLEPPAEMFPNLLISCLHATLPRAVRDTSRLLPQPASTCSVSSSAASPAGKALQASNCVLFFGDSWLDNGDVCSMAPHSQVHAARNSGAI